MKIYQNRSNDGYIHQIFNVSKRRNLYEYRALNILIKSKNQYNFNKKIIYRNNLLSEFYN